MRSNSRMPVGSLAVRVILRPLCAAISVLLAAALLHPVPAAAQSFLEPDAGARQRAQSRKSVRPLRASVARPVAERPAPAPRRTPVEKVAAAPRAPIVKPIPVPKLDLAQQPPEPLVAVISVASQRMVVYGGQGVVADTKVSTGQAGHRTPTGVFSVLQRNRYHESNIYSGAPMPFMQRLTWSGIALHQGVVPGYPASHGCIRLPADFAPRMWGLGRIGMRVLVAPHDVLPAAIEHPRLPVPVMTTIDGGDLGQPAVQTVAMGSAPDQPSANAVAPPYALAHFRRSKAMANQIAAEREVKGAQDLAQERSAEANRAAEALRRLERSLETAERELAEKREALARRQTAAEDAPEAQAVAAAAAEIERLRKEVATAKAEEHRASDAAFDAAKALRAVQDRVDDAAAAARLSASSLEPVSIFVSRKEGKVFVRQGFVPLHEEAISIVEPERPLGTHVFTAIEGRDGGANLRWQAVTLPSNPPAAAAANEPGRKRGVAPVLVQSSVPASSAGQALDRFELPPDTMRLVGDRLWSGATLIVSDFGISGETGRGTDFVVLTQ